MSQMFESVKRLAEIFIAPFYLAYTVCEVAYRAIKWLWGKKEEGAYGDSAFATDKELRKAGRLEPQGFMPGVTMKGRKVYLDSESSAVIFGNRGVGKTQTFIANIKDMKAKPDLIISDPAGDIESVVSEDLRTRGYGFIRLDLSNPMKSDRYDPLSYLKPQSPFEYSRDVMALCTLLLPEGGRMDDTGAHFLESARAMVQSMVMWRTNGGKNADFSDIVLRLLVDKKLRVKEFAQMQSATAHPLVRQGVEAFEAAGDRERGAMDSTLSRKLRPLLDDAVRHVTTPDGERWSFEDIFKANKPIAVFIRSGLGNEEFGGAFTRIVVGNAINTVRRMWNTQISAGVSPRNAALPKGLWIFIDEAKTMGNSPAVVHAVNELRKAKVNCYLCFHTLADVKEVYSSPQALLNGCAWVINGGSRDLELYNAASKLAGERTVRPKSFTEKGQSEHEAGRPLIRPDEFQKLKADEVVVIGSFVAKLKKPFVIKRDHIRYL